MKIAVVEKTKSHTNYSQILELEDFDRFQLLDNPSIKKPKVADITLNKEELEPYDYVILVGAEPCKFVAKIGSVVKYQGHLVDDKWLPLTNPGMLKFKPEGQQAFDSAVSKIKTYLSGSDVVYKDSELNIQGIESEEEALEYIKGMVELAKVGQLPVFGLDTETSALYARDGYLLGVSLTHQEKQGVYINSDCISDTWILWFLELLKYSTPIFHNAKFDLHFFKYHLGIEIENFHDTMLLHYLLDEQPGTHGLKELAIKFTKYGDYDRELDDFKRDYCKKNRIKLADFTYDLIPFDIMYKYAGKDTAVTWDIFHKFYPVVKGSKKLNRVYTELLIPGTKFLQQVEDNGVPFDIERLEQAKINLNNRILETTEKLYKCQEVKTFEARHNKKLNVNSVIQVRELLFDIGGYPIPNKRTDTGAISVDAEVLQDMSSFGEIPKLILEIKKAIKIKSTYIDKVLLWLDRDNRLRTNFNLTTTTSGRLSSSGKLNLQQLPRDDKTVKRCIKARPGHVIISQDLQTAEMYIVAAITGDPVLQQIFINKEDYHSKMAVLKFNLPYTWQEVKEHHTDLRQDAKTVSFEILYKLNLNEPALKKFKVLKRWLLSQKEFIEQNGYVYQFFGRKRRLPNVFSKDSQVQAHEVRSGINSLVQGPASDVNLLAGIDLQRHIKEHRMKSKIFALVHDSLIAEVPLDEVEEYKRLAALYTQKDRGLTINKDTPIGLDVGEGEDYAEAG